MWIFSLNLGYSNRNTIHFIFKEIFNIIIKLNWKNRGKFYSVFVFYSFHLIFFNLKMNESKWKGLLDKHDWTINNYLRKLINGLTRQCQYVFPTQVTSLRVISWKVSYFTNFICPRSSRLCINWSLSYLDCFLAHNFVVKHYMLGYSNWQIKAYWLHTNGFRTEKWYLIDMFNKWIINVHLKELRIEFISFHQNNDDTTA